jgi:hypothetical protein
MRRLRNALLLEGRREQMARVRIEGVIEHVDYDLRRALVDAVNEVIPNAQFDDYALFRAFVRAVGRKCNTWESVPDHLIERKS